MGQIVVEVLVGVCSKEAGQLFVVRQVVLLSYIVADLIQVLVSVLEFKSGRLPHLTKPKQSKKNVYHTFVDKCTATRIARRSSATVCLLSPDVQSSTFNRPSIVLKTRVRISPGPPRTLFFGFLSIDFYCSTFLLGLCVVSIDINPEEVRGPQI